MDSCIDKPREPLLGQDNLALLALIEQQRFGVEYQPLIDTQSGEIMAYEALARFFDHKGLPVAPLDIFQALHESPLMLAQVELQLKRIQLRYRPAGVPLFLNLDPHAYSVFGDQGLTNAMAILLSESPDLIIEIIENTDVNDARMSHHVSEVMRSMGFGIALDDVGAPGTMVSLSILGDVDYIKFDRSWLTQNQSDDMQQLLKSLISFSRCSGKKTVLEGVESAEDLAYAVNMGIDYVQGFFYKELFINEAHY